VIEALQDLPGVEYIDYAADSNRRKIAREATVRVCTFHSARGIEGTRVIIFGFEQLKRLAESTNVDCFNLGYIVLSRSVFELVIVARKMRTALAIPDFIEQVLAAMRYSKPLDVTTGKSSGEVLGNGPDHLRRSNQSASAPSGGEDETLFKSEPELAAGPSGQAQELSMAVTLAASRRDENEVEQRLYPCPICLKSYDVPLPNYRGLPICGECKAILPP
jgi:hypothetical protein